jgi:catechol 2,3-dioxygenase-like lactoylglutathione lyase family enzyme
MADRAVPNLPARDMAATEAFYHSLGFATEFRDAGWMILSRGDLSLEFFPHPGLDPWASDHGACLRVDDLDGLYANFQRAGLSGNPRAIPRLTPPVKTAGVPRMFALVDENGSLLRCLENGSA